MRSKNEQESCRAKSMRSCRRSLKIADGGERSACARAYMGQSVSHAHARPCPSCCRRHARRGGRKALLLGLGRIEPVKRYLLQKPGACSCKMSLCRGDTESWSHARARRLFGLRLDAWFTPA